MVNMVALAVGIFSYVTLMPTFTNGLCRTVFIITILVNVQGTSCKGFSSTC